MTTMLLVLIVLAIVFLPCFAQPSSTPAATQPDPRQALHNHLRRQAHQALAARRAQYEKLKTPDQIAAWQQRSRQVLLEALGDLPERTPLSAKITGREDRDGYRIEKVLFQSRPNFFVTGILYLPESKPPYPGVLVPCGHSRNGKAYESYQKAPILLARNGIAAFCFDPISQGERGQIFDETGQPLLEATLEHTLIGAGSILLGRNVANFFVWDGIRAIDYLLSRPDIDPNRIGCTGTSGGGTQTSYLMSIDPRIVCAVPCCYLTSFERLIDTIGPQDGEQNLFGELACGLNHADFAIMHAPQPLLFGTATQDFFDIDGSWDSFRQAKRIYTRLGHAERVDLVEADLPHNFAAELRVPMTRWMRRWLLGIDDAVTEPDTPVAPDEQLHCTPKGQVQWIEDARSAIDLNADVEAELAEARRDFWKNTPAPAALRKVRQVVGVRNLHDLPQPAEQVISREQRDGCAITHFVLQWEGGVNMPALLLQPLDADQGPTVCLCLDAAGKDASLDPDSTAQALVRAGHTVLAIDLPGLGSLRGPDTNGKWAEYLGPNTKDFFLAYMLGKPYLGIRTEAILAVSRFLSHREAGNKPRPVHLVATGEAGPAALHAAALEPDLFASLELRRSLATWTSVVRTPLHRNQLINVVHAALKVYDLPDLLATLPKQKVKIIDPTDAAGRILQN